MMLTVKTDHKRDQTTKPSQLCHWATNCYCHARPACEYNEPITGKEKLDLTVFRQWKEKEDTR